MYIVIRSYYDSDETVEKLCASILDNTELEDINVYTDAYDHLDNPYIREVLRRQDWCLVLETEDPDDNVRHFDGFDLKRPSEWGKPTRVRSLDVNSLNRIRTPTTVYSCCVPWEEGTTFAHITLAYTTCLPYALILLDETCGRDDYLTLYIPDSSQAGGHRWQHIYSYDERPFTDWEAREDNIVGPRLGLYNRRYERSETPIAVIEHPDTGADEWISLGDRRTTIRFFRDTIGRAWYVYRRDKQMRLSNPRWGVATLDHNTVAKDVDDQNPKEYRIHRGCECIYGAASPTIRDIILSTPHVDVRQVDVHTKQCKVTAQPTDVTIPLEVIHVKSSSFTLYEDDKEDLIAEYIMKHMEEAHRQVHSLLTLRVVETVLGRYTRKKYGYTFRFMA